MSGWLMILISLSVFALAIGAYHVYRRVRHERRSLRSVPPPPWWGKK